MMLIPPSSKASHPAAPDERNVPKPHPDALAEALSDEPGRLPDTQSDTSPAKPQQRPSGRPETPRTRPASRDAPSPAAGPAPPQGSRHGETPAASPGNQPGSRSGAVPQPGDLPGSQPGEPAGLSLSKRPAPSRRAVSSPPAGAPVFVPLSGMPQVDLLSGDPSEALRDDADRPALIAKGPHIGIDEAGRGCLAGPVVAAAVFFPADFDFIGLLPGLADSKKLTEKRRNLMAPLIARYSVAYGLGLAWQDEIDKNNILSATLRAMGRAVLALTAKWQDSTGPYRAPRDLPHLLIDGKDTIPAFEWQFCLRGAPLSALALEHYLPLPSARLPARIPALPEQTAVVGGDNLFPAVSAASVLAKTFRDGLMIKLNEFYPGYGFAEHKGYATKEHLEALARKGVCALHRKSFRKVRPEDEQHSLL